MTKMEKTTKILEMVDVVLESHKGRNFDEYICKIGGDVITYRIYDDGMITVK